MGADLDILWWVIVLVCAFVFAVNVDSCRRCQEGGGVPVRSLSGIGVECVEKR